MNSASALPKDVVLSLRPGDIQLYLTSRGWTGEPFGSAGKGLIFRDSRHPKVELLLPLKRDLGDYAARMAELVITLSLVEQRPAWQIVNDLSGPPGDVFRLRVVAPDSTLGNLPLEKAIDLLRGGRDLFVAAACSTLRPQTLHSQRLPSEASAFVKSCRLGQTERGSFVATIIAPVPPDIQQSLPFGDRDWPHEEEPYARRVTTRLMSSLGLVSTAIQSGNPGRILEAINDGVSANLCEALVKMKPSGDQSHLDIQVSWARNRRLLSPGIPESVSFPQEAFDFISEAGRQLHARALAKRETYRGKIVRLEAALRPLEEVAGKITLSANVEGRLSKLKVELGRDDYNKACDAHRDEKDVSVTGIILHDVKTREFVLSDASDFNVAD